MIRRTDLTVNELTKILNANPQGCNQYGCKGGTGRGSRGSKAGRLKQTTLKPKTKKGGWQRRSKGLTAKDWADDPGKDYGRPSNDTLSGMKSSDYAAGSLMHDILKKRGQ